MLDTLDSYIYTGVSFSTFLFDEVSFLSIKYSLSWFRKKHFIKLIKKSLMKNNHIQVDDQFIKYYIKSTINSLSNASLVVSPNEKEIKLAKKLLKKEITYVESFTIDDLSNEIKNQKATFYLNKKDDYYQYENIIKSFKEVDLIYLEDFIKENNYGSIIDEIRLKILQENDSEIFFTKIDIFSNMINDFVFTLNKIAINL